MVGASTALLSGVFAVRVAIKVNAAFARPRRTRVSGKRAVHRDANWMAEAAKLFPDAGGIVIGERYRVDRNSVAAMALRTDNSQSWGAGGKSPLLCFDSSFCSSHGIVFCGLRQFQDDVG